VFSAILPLIFDNMASSMLQSRQTTESVRNIRLNIIPIVSSGIEQTLLLRDIMLRFAGLSVDLILLDLNLYNEGPLTAVSLLFFSCPTSQVGRSLDMRNGPKCFDKGKIGTVSLNRNSSTTCPKYERIGKRT
jgi:hypothetical protein